MGDPSEGGTDVLKRERLNMGKQTIRIIHLAQCGVIQLFHFMCWLLKEAHLSLSENLRIIAMREKFQIWKFSQSE
jgi:hypothetical protein